jgi:peroxiredoxin
VDSLSIVGLVVVLAGVISYAVLLFVIHGFTYRTWIFDGVVVAGTLLAGARWLSNGVDAPGAVALAVGVAWFPLVRRELRIRGSEKLNLRPGDRFPSMSVLSTEGNVVTDQDLIAHAPTLLVLYRGWWCPSSRAQLDELVGAYDRLSEAGLAVYAGSVDTPSEATAMQEHVGNNVTILCAVPTSLLDAIGVRDTRGAPWYDRILFGAKQQDIAMPAAVVVDHSGTVVYAFRATSVDDRPDPNRIFANLQGVPLTRR